MSRSSPFGHPFLVGFDDVEQALDRIVKASGDGFPPYNVERQPRGPNGPETLRITLAVAGFSPAQLEVTLELNQLTVRGRQGDERDREFLHRGIAARNFQRTFLLADGMDVAGAEMSDGLLTISLVRPEPSRAGRRIEITTPPRQ